MILRHPWMVIAVTIACSIAAGLYVRIATPLYTSMASLRVQQEAPPVLGNAPPPHSSDETSAFLNAELAVLTSTPVLEMALAAPELTAAQTAPTSPDPVVALRKALRVAVGRKDGIISVELDSPSATRAALLLNTIVNAYITYETQQKEQVDQKLLAMLEKEKTQCLAATRDSSEQMLRILHQAGTLTLYNRDKAQELAALRASLRAAQTEAGLAETQYRDAAAALGQDGALRAELEQMNVAGTAPVNSEAEIAQLRLAIAELELKKQELLGRRLLPSHPQIASAQGQLDRLRLLIAASAYGRWAQASARALQLQASVQQQEAFAQDLSQKASLYAQAEQDLKQLDRHSNLLDERIKEVQARHGLGALQISVVEPARAALRPSKPDVPRLLAMAAALGLALGAVVAYLRELVHLRAVLDEPVEEPPQTEEMVLRLTSDLRLPKRELSQLGPL